LSSSLADGWVSNKAQIEIMIGSTRKRSLTKTLSRERKGYNFGTVGLPWKLGDSITVKVTCFRWWGDAKRVVTLKGPATLAYLAGKRLVEFPSDRYTKVKLHLVDPKGWFDFPPP